MEIFLTLLFILLIVLSFAVITLFDNYNSIRDRHNKLVDLFIGLQIKQITDRNIIIRQAEEIAELRKVLKNYEKSEKKTNIRKDTKKK